MQIDRRRFIRSSVLAGAGLVLSPGKGLCDENTSDYFGVHPFILMNPDAVFIMKTNVDVKTNSSVIKKTGLDFGRSVFCNTGDKENGFPKTGKIVIKPNLTCRARNSSAYTIERSMGIVTDAFFVEGVIESLKELGLSSNQLFIREVNCPDDFSDGGYISMAERTGIDLQGINTPVQNLAPEQVSWVNVPGGVFFRRIPYLWPVNAPGTFLINIAKFKTHGMGMTLCAKNLQGTIAANYQAHCSAYGRSISGVSASDLNPAAASDILANYNRHRVAGIPRWDKPGSDGGLWQEIWATRCLDNNSVTFAGLHIIEGIYGRDGDFMTGPAQNGLATDYMTNIIIFGRNQFHVDNIGHYLGGHEPGNFGLFHLALERGMAKTINPGEIPLYEWDIHTGARPVSLESQQRFRLKTYYLQRNYNGQDEPYWHLVNEPYEYDSAGVNDPGFSRSGFHLQQNFPNPVNTVTSIPFRLPSGGNARLEILNTSGKLIEVIVNRNLEGGTHTVLWDSRTVPSGSYICRIHFNSMNSTIWMIVIH
ncbi:MAG TPA: DUF362 domain-containing protein [Bacteroidales bacterium]|jgi:hypothetical protein|nr:DUF362 domain-containing protein [Bacteroidales bacterium]HNR40978.1 DUF362 domain-containing protein [Bacteroidales bacterium]HPM18151.1 DUF362 domain-containing protein [Bacteroidales bacterium]HQG78402.1 DUF362 domain-containing protein [Bacteroidales bacterium]